MLFNIDRKSTRLNSSHGSISYAVFCLKKKKKESHSSAGPLPFAQRIGSTRAGVARSCICSCYLRSSLRSSPCSCSLCFFFFFNDTATTEIYTLSLHDALPIFPTASTTSAPPRTSLALGQP